MSLWSRQKMLRGAVELPTAFLWGAMSAFLLVGIVGEYTHKGYIQVVGGAVSAAFLIVAAYVDSVTTILPDPLLCLAACSAWIGSSHRSASLLFFACASWGACFLLCRWSSLGQGDAKLIGVLYIFTDDVKIFALSIIGAVILAGICAALLLLTARIHRHTTLALGPSLVCSSVAAWCLNHVFH